MEFKLSRKNEGQKWWTWGSFRKNQWGNYQASFKVTPEFKKLINSIEDGEYINFSAFDEDKKDAPKPKPINDGLEGLNDEIPFVWLIPMIAPALALTMLA